MQQITCHFGRGRVASVACEIENPIGGENLAVKMFVKKGRWVYELLWEATELQQLLSVGCNMPHT